MLYTLPSGEKQAFPCILSLFDYDFSGGGTFRVIKEIGEYTAAAEFTLTKGAVISAETPYGFGPMEEVPEYGLSLIHISWRVDTVTDPDTWGVIVSI